LTGFRLTTGRGVGRGAAPFLAAARFAGRLIGFLAGFFTGRFVGAARSRGTSRTGFVVVGRVAGLRVGCFLAEL